MASNMDILQSVIQGTSSRKTRLRGRDGRNDDKDVIRFTSSSSDHRLNVRNPTRTIPDVLGFTPLSKQEIKRDRRDIVRRSSFMTNDDSDSEIEDIESIVNLASQPLCTQESALPNKRQRLVNWYMNPEKMKSDLENISNKFDMAHKQYISLEEEEYQWQHQFELMRQLVVDTLITCQKSNQLAIEDTKELFDLLMKTCNITEIKKPAPIVREVLDCYETKKLTLNKLIEDYINTITQYNQQQHYIEGKNVLEDMNIPIVEYICTDPNIQAAILQKNDTRNTMEIDDDKANKRSLLTRKRSNSISSSNSKISNTAVGGEDYLYKLNELYALLEEDIVEREVRKYDVEPFFTDNNEYSENNTTMNNNEDTNIRTIQFHNTTMDKVTENMMTSSTASAAAAAAVVIISPLKAFSWHIETNMNDSPRSNTSSSSSLLPSSHTCTSSESSYTFDHIIENERLLIKCLNHHAKIGNNYRRKRKNTVNPIKINAHVYQPIPYDYPQLLSASSTIQSRNIGMIYPYITNVLKTTTTTYENNTNETLSPSSNNATYTTCKHHTQSCTSASYPYSIHTQYDNEAYKCYTLTTEIAYLEAKIREKTQSLSLWQTQSNDFTKSIQKSTHSMNMILHNFIQEMDIINTQVHGDYSNNSNNNTTTNIVNLSTSSGSGSTSSSTHPVDTGSSSTHPSKQATTATTTSNMNESQSQSGTISTSLPPLPTTTTTTTSTTSRASSGKSSSTSRPAKKGNRRSV